MCNFEKKHKIFKLKVGQHKDFVTGKVVIKAVYKFQVLDLKGGLWVFRKSQNISTANTF